MLTMNLWSSVGLCNGATGTVVDIVYQNNHQPPDLPIAVIVKFENDRGPVFNESQPLCIPVYPVTVSSQAEVGFHERQQLPLGLAWALTIHKSQGQTFQKHGLILEKLIMKEQLEFFMLLLAEQSHLHRVSLNQ